MAKAKVFRVSTIYDRSGTTSAIVGTLSELIEAHAYTLDCGRSYQHEKGNKKINCQPKSIRSLITNLNNAVNNSASDGYAGKRYDWQDVHAE